MLLRPDWAAGVHHDGSAAYVSNPLPSYGEIITISLRVPADAPLTGVFLRTMPDGEFRFQEMKRGAVNGPGVVYSVSLKVDMPVTGYRFKLMTANASYEYTTQGIIRASSPEIYDWRVLADYQAPLWVRDAVFYQIFTDRFHNGDPSNDVREGEYTREGVASHKREWGELPAAWHTSRSLDFYGGDLQGIAQKLDYLQELGVTALYLCPIFVAGSNHKYDIRDFEHVDPHFGGNEALAELRAALDERGMRLILDVTPNHIGYDHPWYTSARKDPKADSADFFAYDPETGSIETWLGVPSLIKLNYSSQKLRERMYRQPDSVLQRWLQPPYGIDGWRLDVANMTGNLHRNQLDHEVWSEMRQALKAHDEDVYLMGEYFQDPTPHLQGAELDAAMNYQGFNIPVRRWLGGEDIGAHDHRPYSDTSLLPTEAMAEQMQRYMGAIPYVVALQQFNQLDSHDTTRILHVTRGDKALVRLGAALMVAFPGTPCFYYGTEIGMPGGKDPDNRRTMPWDESDWDQEMLDYTRQLIRIRRSSPALIHGGWQMLYAEGDWFAFARQSEDQTIIFAGYRGPDGAPPAQIPAQAAGLADGTKLVDQLGGASYTVSDGLLVLRGQTHGQALILEVQP